MRARMGFVQAFLYGTGAFTVVTAAFCVALSIAISGPPTQSEENGLQAAAGDAARSLQHAARRVGVGLCRRIPDLVRLGACAAPEVQETSFAPSHHHAPPIMSPVTPSPVSSPAVTPRSDIVPVADAPPEPNLEPAAEPAIRPVPLAHTRALRPQRRIALAGGRTAHPVAHVERVEVSAHETVTRRAPHAAHTLPTHELAAASSHHQRQSIAQLAVSAHRAPAHVHTHAQVQHVQLQRPPPQHAVTIQAAAHVVAPPHASAAPAHAALHAGLPVGAELAAATSAHEESASNTEAAAPAMARHATAEAARERNPAQALQDNTNAASDAGSGAATSVSDKQ